MKYEKEGFKITGSRGFHVTFKNGVTVSVQFGGGSYSDNHDSVDIGSEPQMRQLESPNAEIAIWECDGKWITRKFHDANDDVLGRVTPKEVLDALNWASRR